MTDKSDMNRVGLFQEMKYISIQDPYKPSYKCKYNFIPFYCYLEYNDFVSN